MMQILYLSEKSNDLQAFFHFYNFDNAKYSMCNEEENTLK